MLTPYSSDEPTKSKLVTVVMVSYNAMPFLDGLLDSLSKQTFQDFDVVIYDNGSTDGTIRTIRSRCPAFRVVELGHNTGFSYPNNLGIFSSQSRYILTLNFDVVLESDFLERLVESLSEHDEVGWVAPKMFKLVDGKKSSQFDCFGHHMRKWRCATSYDPNLPRDPNCYVTRERVFGASACAALYKREMLEDVAIRGEVFDNDFFAYFEDIDLDWRAQRAGWKCLFIPEAIGYHARGGSGLSKSPQIAMMSISNRILSIIKNDFPSHFVADFKDIASETLNEIKPYIKSDPFIGIKLLSRILRLTPAMLKKRWTFSRRVRASKNYMRSIIY